jgi:beta-adrenergic-receptor kinase
MEELQDAIEDAQYVNAMTDEGPKPSKEWPYPDKQTLTDWKASKSGTFFELETLCEQSMPLYMLSRYVKEETTHSAEMLFVEDCCRYRRLYGNVARGSQCNAMIEAFGGSTEVQNIDMLESNLERKIHGSYTDADLEKMTADTIGKGTGPLALGGPLWDEAVAGHGSKNYDDHLWDKLDAVVFKQLSAKVTAGFTASLMYEKMCQFLYLQEATVEEDDFALFRVLGRGGFGMVNGCKKCTSGKLYAMKVMNKKRVKLKRSEQLTLNERVALAAVDSPFVVSLKYAFVSDVDVFLILDLMTGGDLSFHLAQKQKFSKEEAQYYAARIMLGCQALHDEGYVYRDLKPENILMGEDGKVRITDLGLACKITKTLHGAAGTRGYWAPEMLRRDKKGKKMPYGHCVDWWSFGCMLAEFISGVCPFRSEAALKYGQDNGKTEKEKAIDLATLEMEPEWDPESFDADAADICSKLLIKDEKKRLGWNGAKELMDHPWFKEIDWEMIISDRQVPPYLPPKDVNAASQSDIGQFSEDKAFKNCKLEEKDQQVYKEWNWTNPRSFQTEVIEFLMYEKALGRPLTPPRASSGGCCQIS